MSVKQRNHKAKSITTRQLAHLHLEKYIIMPLPGAGRNEDMQPKIYTTFSTLCLLELVKIVWMSFFRGQEKTTKI